MLGCVARLFSHGGEEISDFVLRFLWSACQRIVLTCGRHRLVCGCIVLLRAAYGKKQTKKK